MRGISFLQSQHALVALVFASLGYLPDALTRHARVRSGNVGPACILNVTGFTEDENLMEDMIGVSGIIDSLARLQIMMTWARDYNCMMVPPPPWTILNIMEHNFGARLNHSIWWDSYIQVPDDMWREVPPGALSLGTSETLPTAQDMQKLQRLGKERVAVLTTNWGRGVFFSEGKDHICSTLSEATRSASFWCQKAGHTRHVVDFELPPDVCEQAKSAWAAIGRREETMTVHLRRGDTVKNEDGWEACTAPPRVAAVLQRFRAERQPCKAAKQLVVLTDDRDPAYLSGLRSALLDVFDQVLFEWEVQGNAYLAPTGLDNYRVARFNDAFVGMSQCRGEFHYSNQKHLLCDEEPGQLLAGFKPIWTSRICGVEQD